jgi:hypothetical protein
LSYDRVSHFAGAKWRTSSYTNSGGSCVEVRVTMEGVLIRDSKDRRGDRPILGFDTDGWRSLIGFVGR